jgi:hypothetical protein
VNILFLIRGFKVVFSLLAQLFSTAEKQRREARIQCERVGAGRRS